MQDAQGHGLSGATAEAAGHFDRAVRVFTLSHGDVLGAFDAALGAAPQCAMAVLGKAWVFTLSNDAILAAKARPLIEAARALPMNERERAHLSALGHAVEGHRASSVRVLDRHLMRYPHDLLAHFAALHGDAFHGRFGNVRDRAARALPFWSKEQASYGILLSFYGFGLEEAGHYAQSEDVSRRAAKLEPLGYWPHHAVSHVMEMTGRPREGLRWMDEREAFWNTRDSTSRVHVWWHKSLFHVELGETEAALAIYDGPILATQRPVGVSLTNATALLWRLEMLGCAAGERWAKLADLWRNHADGKLCLFADLHAVMSAIRAGDGAELDRLTAAMRRTASGDTESAAGYRSIGLPLVDGLAAFDRGAYAEAVEHLLPARVDLWRIGGSHAQRDVIDWTLTEAAVRGGLRDVALSLANERLALRPESRPNQRFRRNAEAIAA